MCGYQRRGIYNYNPIAMYFLIIATLVTPLRLVQENCKLYRANTVMTTCIVSKFSNEIPLAPPVSFKNK